MASQARGGRADKLMTDTNPRLYNADLAPTSQKDQKWGWFEIFNVWTNDIQSLFGYSLAASLFLTYSLNGWLVFCALVLASLFVMVLANLAGAPSVKYGIPYPVFARASMGVFGANFPAMLRGIVAIFWYGAQTYFASTAIALLIGSATGLKGESFFLGMTLIDWISFAFVSGFQIYLFWNGIDFIRKFLNFAGPTVYAIMIVLMIVIWIKADINLLSQIGTLLATSGEYQDGALAAFAAIFGTMVAYFSGVVVNFGDFARFTKNEKEMKKGNFWGLPFNMILFSFIALMITAGTIAVFGKHFTNPIEIVNHVDHFGLTLIAAFAFFTATVGINLVANFVPPAYDLANLIPEKISFRTGGLITAGAGFLIGGLWVAVISQIGILPFVNTLGAILAPVYGIMMIDYYIIKKENLDISHLFSADNNGAYYYHHGWNSKALIAMGLADLFSIAAVWHPALSSLGGYAWIIGAALGAGLHYILHHIYPTT